MSTASFFGQIEFILETLEMLKLFRIKTVIYIGLQGTYLQYTKKHSNIVLIQNYSLVPIIFGS